MKCWLSTTSQIPGVEFSAQKWPPCRGIFSCMMWHCLGRIMFKVSDRLPAVQLGFSPLPSPTTPAFAPSERFHVGPGVQLTESRSLTVWFGCWFMRSFLSILQETAKKSLRWWPATTSKKSRLCFQTVRQFICNTHDYFTQTQQEIHLKKTEIKVKEGKKKANEHKALEEICCFLLLLQCYYFEKQEKLSQLSAFQYLISSFYTIIH